MTAPPPHADVRSERVAGQPAFCAADGFSRQAILVGLETSWLARELHFQAETDSTNRVAQELLAGGAAHGTTVVADAQSAGRGRHGRSFFSPAGRNLYTSIVLRPQTPLPQAHALVLAAGVAVAECVAETLGDARRVELKWPNDVLIDGRKTSGVLMEASSRGSELLGFVLGIGVNLNLDANEFPEELRARATSVAAGLRAPVSRVKFACRLYGKLEPMLDETAALGFDAGPRARFEAFFRMRGREVTVTAMSGATLAGRVLGVAADGALRIETAGGRVERVLAGDVTLATGVPR